MFLGQNFKKTFQSKVRLSNFFAVLIAIALSASAQAADKLVLSVVAITEPGLTAYHPTGYGMNPSEDVLKNLKLFKTTIEVHESEAKPRQRSVVIRLQKLLNPILATKAGSSGQRWLMTDQEILQSQELKFEAENSVEAQNRAARCPVAAEYATKREGGRYAVGTNCLGESLQLQLRKVSSGDAYEGHLRTNATEFHHPLERRGRAVTFAKVTVNPTLIRVAPHAFALKLIPSTELVSGEREVIQQDIVGRSEKEQKTKLDEAIQAKNLPEDKRSIHLLNWGVQAPEQGQSTWPNVAPLGNKLIWTRAKDRKALYELFSDLKSDPALSTRFLDIAAGTVGSDYPFSLVYNGTRVTAVVASIPHGGDTQFPEEIRALAEDGCTVQVLKMVGKNEPVTVVGNTCL